MKAATFGHSGRVRGTGGSWALVGKVWARKWEEDQPCISFLPVGTSKHPSLRASASPLLRWD